MIKWEYKIVEDWMSQENLNALGLEGWELLTVFGLSVQDISFIFKRRLS